jgi:pimeloyl-ACP methyl ester carboxylesterase
MRGRRQPWWRDPRLGQRRSVRLRQGELVYFEAGSGEPLVLVHGPLMNANVWRAVVPLLARRFRCLTLELPYGAHPAAMPDAELSFPGLAGLVTGAIRALGLERVTVIGSDGGNPVAQVAITTHPELFARAVVTSGGAYRHAPPRSYAFLTASARVISARMLVGPLWFRSLRRIPIAFGRVAKYPIDHAVTDTWVLPAILDKGIGRDLRRMLRTVNPAQTYTEYAGRMFARFPGPVLVAWSADDRVYPRADAERMVREFPDARLALVEDAFALSPLDQPERLAELVTEFVTDTDVARALQRQ